MTTQALRQQLAHLADMQAALDALKIELNTQLKEFTTMYGRSRNPNWYMAAFWLVTGILIGQFLRFDIDLAPRDSALPVSPQLKTHRKTPCLTKNY